MVTDPIAKLLFPRHAEWERKKFMKMTVWIVSAAVFFALIVSVIIIFEGLKNPN